MVQKPAGPSRNKGPGSPKVRRQPKPDQKKPDGSRTLIGIAGSREQKKPKMRKKKYKGRIDSDKFWSSNIMQARLLAQFFQQCIGRKKLPGDLILEPEVVLDIKSFGESHGVDVSMPGFYAGGALAAVVADQLHNDVGLKLAGLHFLSADGVAGYVGMNWLIIQNN